MATPNAEQQEALDLHNKAREEVGNGPLRWHAICADAAAAHAKALAQADAGMEHADQPEDASLQGENLACGRGMRGRALIIATQGWLDEKPAWQGQAITEQSQKGKEEKHYTQMIWGGSKCFGIAAATGRSGTTYVVGRYYPAGNMIGRKPAEKVAPPSALTSQGVRHMHGGAGRGTGGGMGGMSRPGGFGGGYMGAMRGMGGPGGFGSGHTGNMGHMAAMGAMRGGPMGVMGSMGHAGGFGGGQMVGRGGMGSMSNVGGGMIIMRNGTGGFTVMNNGGGGMSVMSNGGGGYMSYSSSTGGGMSSMSSTTSMGGINVNTNFNGGGGMSYVSRTTGPGGMDINTNINGMGGVGGMVAMGGMPPGMPPGMVGMPPPGWTPFGFR
ncbi:hypothetical protein B0A48_00633 [Cryoendolithus antarcticus]|uniref:SCP domain-containing protein n=1 Tax=Cryoendolithus antarcticus TaxID=1507870 RepID=A0A1V8TV26_9PEZI|nr:hypothetical protein B0A48_00633 [Cryoendolithus antarcticus]